MSKDDGKRTQSGEAFKDRAQSMSIYEGSIDHANPQGFDIGQIFKTLIAGKWTIIAWGAMAALLAGTVFLFVPFGTTVTMDIRPLPFNEMQKYNWLNSVKIERGDQERSLFPVSRGQLVSMFINEVSLRNTLADAIRDSGLLDRLAGEGDDDYRHRIVEESHKFKILELSEGEERSKLDKLQAVITYTGRDRDKIRSVIFDALNRSTAKLRKSLVDSFTQFVELEKLKKKQKLEDIDGAISLAIEKYNKNIARRKKILREQAAIARGVDLSNGTIKAFPLDSNSTVVAVVDQSLPLYFRGYKALEEELDEISKRKDVRDFAPDLVNLQISRSRIENNPTIDRLKAAFEQSPLTSDAFAAVYYQEYAADLKTSNLRLIIPFLILVFGSLAGVAVVFVRFLLR